MSRLAMRAVANGKFWAFFNKLVNLETKKITAFQLIRLYLQNKIILEKMFIPTTSQHSHPYREYFTV